MDQENFKSQVRLIHRYLVLTITMIALVIVIAAYFALTPNASLFDNGQPEESIVENIQIDPSEIDNGVHTPTGFKDGKGLTLVIENCTACHSAKLVTQNRASREGWIGMIRWMQETQNLWDLGEDENEIVEYLATYYAPEQKGRRQNIEITEWYELK